MKKTIAAIWDDQRVRFLIIGGVNTGVGFLLFAIIQILVGDNITYVGSLIVSHIIASTLAFILYKLLVFRARGRLWAEYLRFQSVYLGAFLANLFMLPTLVALTGWNPIIVQGITVVVLSVSSYLGHRYFSFRPKTSKFPTEPKE